MMELADPRQTDPILAWLIAAEGSWHGSAGGRPEACAVAGSDQALAFFGGLVGGLGRHQRQVEIRDVDGRERYSNSVGSRKPGIVVRPGSLGPYLRTCARHSPIVVMSYQRPDRES